MLWPDTNFRISPPNSFPPSTILTIWHLSCNPFTDQRENEICQILYQSSLYVSLFLFYCKYEYIYRCIPPRVCILPLQPLHLSSPSLLSSSSPLYQVPRHHCTATLKRGKERKTFSCNNNLLKRGMPSLNTCGDGWSKKGDWSARCVDFFLRGYRTLLTDTSPSIQIMLLAPGDPLADAEKIYWPTFKNVSVYKQPLLHIYASSNCPEI